MLRWDDIHLFLAVAEAGSLSGAARVLRLGQPTLSRRIHELELKVGEPLFARHTKGSPLTIAGQRLLPAAMRMAEWAAEAQANLTDQGYRRAEGTVRVAAPPGIATEMLLPLVVGLRVSHPALKIQIRSGVEVLNLNRGEADLSLRTQRPTDAGLEVLDEIASAMRVYAAPAYASRLPARPRPGQIDWIAWAPPYDELSLNRTLRAGIPGFSPVLSSDDYLVLIAACRAGVGALVLPQDMAGAAKDLVELPVAFDLGPPAELFLVAHTRHRQLAKLQPVIAAIRARFEALRRFEAPAAPRRRARKLKGPR